MGIWYKYVGYDSPLTSEAKDLRVRPIVVANGHLHTREVIEKIVKNNYYSEPDASKALSSVFAVIEELLQDGNTITIDGYGTFSLTAQFVKKNVDNRDEQKKEKSTERRAENIEVKGVVFKATSGMKKRIGVSNFERLPKDVVKRRHTKRG